jgi:hypothetical protein
VNGVLRRGGMIGIAVAVLLVVWLGSRTPLTPARAPAPAGLQAAALVMAGPEPVSPAKPATVQQPDDPREPGAKTHPLTAEHARLHHEVILIDDIYAALEARAFDRAGELLAKYRELYAGISPDIDEGLGLLLACMEHPSPESRARAQRFFDTETYSTARRRIKRWCLDR